MLLVSTSSGRFNFCGKWITIIILDAVVSRLRWCILFSYDLYALMVFIVLKDKLFSVYSRLTSCLSTLSCLVVRHLKDFLCLSLDKIDVTFTFWLFRRPSLRLLASITNCHGAVSTLIAHPINALVSWWTAPTFPAIVANYDFWLAEWSSYSCEDSTTLAIRGSKIIGWCDTPAWLDPPFMLYLIIGRVKELIESLKDQTVMIWHQIRVISVIIRHISWRFKNHCSQAPKSHCCHQEKYDPVDYSANRGVILVLTLRMLSEPPESWVMRHTEYEIAVSVERNQKHD